MKMDDTKLDPKDLKSPRRELSGGSLEIAVTLLVCSRIDFVCVCVSLISNLAVVP